MLEAPSDGAILAPHPFAEYSPAFPFTAIIPEHMLSPRFGHPSAVFRAKRRCPAFTERF
jgi:hypothetical protein